MLCAANLLHWFACIADETRDTVTVIQWRDPTAPTTKPPLLLWSVSHPRMEQRTTTPPFAFGAFTGHCDPHHRTLTHLHEVMTRLHTVRLATAMQGRVAVTTMRSDLSAALCDQICCDATHRPNVDAYAARLVTHRGEAGAVRHAEGLSVNSHGGSEHTEAWEFRDARSATAAPAQTNTVLAVYYVASGCFSADIAVVMSAISQGHLAPGCVVVLQVRLPVGKKRRKSANAFLAKTIERLGVCGHIRIHHLLADRHGERTITMVYTGGPTPPHP